MALHPTSSTEAPDVGASTPGCPAPDDEGPIVSHISDGAPPQLTVLSDAYAIAIVEALADGPKRGRELIDDCGGARSTVYRHLDRLIRSGLVAAETTLDPDGHHHKTYHLVRDTIAVRVERNGLTVTLRGE
ncbi:MAG: DNA-binding transcriptional ArsR family regulator [Halobacteriales archaeon]|jgi:DNA-binding transcriptional ArsR family regulator